MLAETFKKPKSGASPLILGKVQLLALPGAPGWDGHWEPLVTRAEQEATALATGGVDGLIIENYHDTPYTSGRLDVAGAVALAMLTRRLKQFTALPIGLSVLQNDPETALAVAINTEADFIRIPLLTGALVTDSGVINSRFHELLQYKNRLKAELPFLLVDISAKHLGPDSTPPTDGKLNHLLRLSQTLPAQVEDLALVVPDEDIEPSELTAFKRESGRELLVETKSGASKAAQYFEQADGLILDADLRKKTAPQPNVLPTIDMTRVEELINRLRKVVPVGEMDPDIFLKR